MRRLLFGFSLRACGPRRRPRSRCLKSLFTRDRNELRPARVRIDLHTFLFMRLHETDLTMNSDRSEFVPFSCIKMTANLSPGPELSSLYAFGSAIYLLDKTCHFVRKPGTKHFVPVSCKRLQKFHTGLS